MPDHPELIPVARICHEVNRVWCEYQGDTSQVPWDEAPSNIQESALNGVLFHVQNPDAGDDASHENWRKFKTADGWVYGEVKDTEAKIHPCMVPFAELPPEQQVKDRFFRTIVHAALAA